MIILKIKEKGYTLSIPGMKTVRTPADIDISKLDMRTVVMYLKTLGIEKYEIVSQDNIEAEVKKKNTKVFEISNRKRTKENQDVNKRIENIEEMLQLLLFNTRDDSISEKEQINNKLEVLENLIRSNKHIQLVDKSPALQYIKRREQEPEIEELEAFIPEVDISDMKIKSDIKIIKQDSSEAQDSADLLSSLIKK
jgi:hypothetical protein